MSRKKLAAVSGVAAVALATGLALTATTAHADEHTSSAFGVSAAGFVDLLNVPKNPYVTNANGAAEASLAEVGSPLKVVHAKALNVQARDGYASSRVVGAKVNLSVLPTPLDLKLGASVIEAKCDNGKATSSIVGAKLGDKKLEVDVPANTKIEVPGIASVTLNQQVTKKDGSVTVTAIAVDLLNGAQTVDIASATCGAKKEKPSEEPTPTTKPSAGGDAPKAAPKPKPVQATLDVTG